jgi:maleylacetate reductase
MQLFEEGYSGYYDPAEDLSKVVFGTGAAGRLAEEVSALGERALLVTSSSIEEHTDIIEKVKEALGPGLVGIFTGSVPHTPRSVVLEASDYARSLDPDVIISLGGGSDTDTGKALRLALWLGIEAQKDFDDAYQSYKNDWHGVDAATLEKPMVPQIGMPTTLISAEFTQGVGISLDEGHGKQVFSHPNMKSSVIVLDATLSATTPERLWFSTGVKALEHAVAKLTALKRNPVIDAIAAQAVSLLSRELTRCKQDPEDLVARGNLLVGSWLCMFGSWRSLVERMGLSHALGRQVGGVSGASHGLISAVLLPICMDFNASAGGSGQRLLARALGVENTSDNPEEAAHQSADKVRQVVQSLGLPARLRDIGVEESDLQLIAEKTMTDMSAARNPRPLTGPEEVLGLLESAW